MRLRALRRRSGLFGLAFMYYSPATFRQVGRRGMGKHDRGAEAAPQRRIGVGLAACALALGLVCGLLPAGRAGAQTTANGGVTVDYGALDSAPPAPSQRPPSNAPT